MVPSRLRAPSFSEQNHHLYFSQTFIRLPQLRSSAYIRTPSLLNEYTYAVMCPLLLMFDGFVGPPGCHLPQHGPVVESVQNLEAEKLL